jgi:hydroxymethylbilane synthase
MTAKNLRLGTRGSALALTQSENIKKALVAQFPDLSVDIVVIKTTGDKMQDTPLKDVPGKGIFIKEIEEALLENNIDLAVHSLKDLPTVQPDGLSIAAIPLREDPRDCVISRFGEQILELPRGGTVGTSSVRRQAQILAVKKVRFENMRGNLDTRIKKVLAGDVTSIVVALAGVKRLGREDEVSQILEPDFMLPAPAQGCLGIEVREKDAETLAYVAALDHKPSRAAAEAERAFLMSLGGGCRVPIAALATLNGDVLTLKGLVISPDGKKAVRGDIKGPVSDAAHMGSWLGAKLLGEGASEILIDLPPDTTGTGA